MINFSDKKKNPEWIRNENYLSLKTGLVCIKPQWLNLRFPIVVLIYRWKIRLFGTNSNLSRYMHISQVIYTLNSKQFGLSGFF